MIKMKEEKKYGKYENYEIEDAARVLQEAEEIKKDSKKMEYVQKCLEEKLKNTKKAVSSIQEIRDEYNSME